MNTYLNNILNQYANISLADMKDVRLMHRQDTKYLIQTSMLPKVLGAASKDYYVQENSLNERIASYHTMYLDTPNKLMYILHETGRSTREKIRMRTYMDTKETFLELKLKNNHGRTTKKRIIIPDMESLFNNEEAASFVHEKSSFELEGIAPHIENRFNRITLVNKAKTERLTIDFNLWFHNLENGRELTLNNVVIIELKRNGLTFSPMKQMLLEMGIREGGFSKYCIGCAMTDASLRRNNLKVKINRINKF